MTPKNLAAERTRVDMTQAECATALGVSVKQLGKFEADAGTMPGEVVKKASELFGCSCDYLLGITDQRY